MIKSLMPNVVKGFAISSWGASFFFQRGSRVGGIRVLEGPEWGWFEQNTDRCFLSQRFIVSDRSNRMGYRLKGFEVESLESKELISSAVCPGTIQISHDGMPILLMAEAQTTGGYPRIVQVCAADLPFCAQLRPGDAVGFEKIQMAEAETLFLQQRRGLRRLEMAFGLRFNQ
jgi:antagonist of KipI